MQKLYAIKDTKGAFSEPFVAINDQIAVRNVKTLVNGQKGSTWSLYPEDFELWSLADYDELTGIIVPKDLEFIVRLANLKDGQDA